LRYIALDEKRCAYSDHDVQRLREAKVDPVVDGGVAQCAPERVALDNNPLGTAGIRYAGTSELGDERIHATSLYEPAPALGFVVETKNPG
jgi:hypothetical protein